MIRRFDSILGLSDKDKLVRVLLDPLFHAKNSIVHLAHILNLLFVCRLNPRATDALVRLTDDRDEEVEKQDDVEDGAEQEDEPLVFIVEATH